MTRLLFNIVAAPVVAFVGVMVLVGIYKTIILMANEVDEGDRHG